jgi:hypothetical protein
LHQPINTFDRLRAHHNREAAGHPFLFDLRQSISGRPLENGRCHLWESEVVIMSISTVLVYVAILIALGVAASVTFSAADKYGLLTS